MDNDKKKEDSVFKVRHGNLYAANEEYTYVCYVYAGGCGYVRTCMGPSVTLRNKGLILPAVSCPNCGAPAFRAMDVHHSNDADPNTRIDKLSGMRNFNDAFQALRFGHMIRSASVMQNGDKSYFRLSLKHPPGRPAFELTADRAFLLIPHGRDNESAKNTPHDDGGLWQVCGRSHNGGNSPSHKKIR